MPHEVLHIGPGIVVLPIIHGSGDFALEVRRMMLENRFDCVAVPLPESFREDVEEGIDLLPLPSLAVQAEPYDVNWAGSAGDHGNHENLRAYSYVPVDPCQGVIAALRLALQERLPRAYIDLEVDRFLSHSAIFPDPFALKKVPVERFATALLPAVSRPASFQTRARLTHMASRLRQLEVDYGSILLVCSILDWPWIREAYIDRVECEAEPDWVEASALYQSDRDSLIFQFGELPFITGLYERARTELEDDETLSIDGVKELFIAARQAYEEDLKGRHRQITPQLLAHCLHYVRNLTLMERRLTPDLYTLVIAAKQVVGDQYALHVAETARKYPYHGDTALETIKLGIDKGRMSDGEVVRLVNRLPGPAVTWRRCELRRRPDDREVKTWRMRWNPFAQCSYPPEDDLVENFRSHLFDRAKTIMGADLARTEKFTTSIKDGVDIRDTLRHWYEGDIYVKVLPPNRGHLDCAVMLFDSPADPRDYPWRVTWFAEHDKESTLSFFATDYRSEMVGPGIAMSSYGGTLFLFPHVAIPDIWQDPRLDFTLTLEERLLAAACLHSRSSQIALLSTLPPGPGWRRLARRFKKRWVHVPLSQMSSSTVQKLRKFHVLNGKRVRSYASHFIVKP